MRKSLILSVCVALLALPSAASAARWHPAPTTAAWQWELQGKFELTPGASVFEIDGFEYSAGDVKAIHAQGAKAICYLDVGSWEEYRPDAGEFPRSGLGNEVTDHPHALGVEGGDGGLRGFEAVDLVHAGGVVRVDLPLELPLPRAGRRAGMPAALLARVGGLAGREGTACGRRGRGRGTAGDQAGGDAGEDDEARDLRRADPTHARARPPGSRGRFSPGSCRSPARLRSSSSTSATKSSNLALFGEIVVDMVWSIDTELEEIQADAKVAIQSMEQGFESGMIFHHYSRYQ